MQQQAAACDQNRRMQRIDPVQPDRGRGKPEGEAAAAGGNTAEQRTEPEDENGVERQEACHHPDQPRLSRKTKPTAKTAAVQIDSAVRVLSRKPRNSIASTRRPSVK